MTRERKETRQWRVYWHKVKLLPTKTRLHLNFSRRHKVIVQEAIRNLANRSTVQSTLVMCVIRNSRSNSHEICGKRNARKIACHWPQRSETCWRSTETQILSMLWHIINGKRDYLFHNRAVVEKLSYSCDVSASPRVVNTKGTQTHFFVVFRSRNEMKLNHRLFTKTNSAKSRCDPFSCKDRSDQRIWVKVKPCT